VGRLANLFNRHSTDDRLLGGKLSPDSGQGKERSEQLTSSHHRGECARALRELVEEAAKPSPSLFNANLRVHRMAIRDSSPLILTLARELEELPEVDPRGVILADRLVRDGDSPAYARDDHGELRTAVEQAREALSRD